MHMSTFLYRERPMDVGNDSIHGIFQQCCLVTAAALTTPLRNWWMYSSLNSTDPGNHCLKQLPLSGSLHTHGLTFFRVARAIESIIPNQPSMILRQPFNLLEYAASYTVSSPGPEHMYVHRQLERLDCLELVRV